MFNLLNKKILITGGSGFLGKEICKSLLCQGAEVIAIGRKNKKIFEDEIFYNKKFKYISCDLTQKKSINKIIDTCDETLNVIINNAYSGNSGSIENSKYEDFLKSYNYSIGITHNLILGLLPKLRAARKNGSDASVINISSMYALVSPDLTIYKNKFSANPPFYGSAKSALINYTKYFASEFGKEGIRSNSISFGPFPNPKKNLDKKFLSALKKKTLLKRLGSPKDAAGIVIFLSSDESSFITGENIIVDGGWTCI